jgi:hypothetical protein
VELFEGGGEHLTTLLEGAVFLGPLVLILAWLFLKVVRESREAADPRSSRAHDPPDDRTGSGGDAKGKRCEHRPSGNRSCPTGSRGE